MTQYVSKCEVCEAVKMQPVLDLGRHPMCDDLIPVDYPLRCEKYPIKILYCEQCYTAHQAHQVTKSLLFPRTYHYRSRFTADVLSGMASLVDAIEDRMGTLAGRVVLDVGCNDGSLLDKFAAKGAVTIGVEPTDAYADAEGRGHVIINEFFSSEAVEKVLCIQPKIDVITFTNVFAHIEDLPTLLRNVKRLMANDSVLVVENHYLGAVLEKNQFDTFYHEHPRTYSLRSFIEIAKNLGCKVNVVEFPHRYGGNIRVMIGRDDWERTEQVALIEAVLVEESKFLERFALMREFIEKWRVDKRAQIFDLVAQYGKIAGKAFPGRAAILIELLGLSEKELACVYEKPGSLKIGHYVPGTRIPIVSDEELFANADKHPVILNLAWHIQSEIEGYLRAHGFGGRVVHIL